MYTRARARRRCVHGKTRCIVITVTTPHCCRVVSEREIEKERGKVEHKKKQQKLKANKTAAILTL